MQDPKFRFGRDDVIYRHDGGESIPADEPVVLLRGKDQVTVLAILKYIEVMEQFPDSKLAREHAESMSERLRVISLWQVRNPDRVGMGCHSCADPSCREKLDLN